MSTLATVRDEVKANLTIVGTSQNTAIDGYIRASLRTLRQKRYWFLRRRDTLTLAQAGYSVSLPANFSVIDFASLVHNGKRYTQKNGFDLLDYKGLMESIFDSTRKTRRPYSLAIAFDDTLETDSLSDIAASIELVYFCQDETLPTLDDDTSVWFDDGFDVVRASTQLLYAQFNEGNIEAPATELTAFLKRLDDKQTFNIGTGQV
jgi:hypothetical protein